MWFALAGAAAGGGGAAQPAPAAAPISDLAAAMADLSMFSKRGPSKAAAAAPAEAAAKTAADE
jgi:hypothetical protein